MSYSVLQLILSSEGSWRQSEGSPRPMLMFIFIILNLTLFYILFVSGQEAFLVRSFTWDPSLIWNTGYWRPSNGTWLLTHLTPINLFIKLAWNISLLPPLLSIAFVPSASCTYVWSTRKAYIFCLIKWSWWDRLSVKEPLRYNRSVKKGVSSVKS